MTTKRILIVDDDPMIRDLVFFAFAGKDYVVAEAEDGRKALAALRDKRPDVVLLDAHMPELDGFQTLDAIQRDPALRDIPIIMLTGLRTARDVRHATEMGASGYIAKPFNPETLFERVTRTLQAM